MNTPKKIFRLKLDGYDHYFDDLMLLCETYDGKFPFALACMSSGLFLYSWQSVDESFHETRKKIESEYDVVEYTKEELEIIKKFNDI